MKYEFKYIKLAIFSVLFLAFYLLVINSSPPVGMVGDVVRNNIAEDIDASPLFYAEVEHMGELEDGILSK